MDPENPRRLDFYYDEQGALLGFRYNGQDYWYIRNGQGDIAGILDSTGTQVVGYTYDSWGVPISVTGSMADTIGEINPFRYRGYYYDSETGLYYLNSRYYDPVIGRFVTADTYAHTGDSLIGGNMYVYCYNNPIMNIDPTGELTLKNLLVGIGIGVAVVAGIAAIAALTVATAGVGTATLATGGTALLATATAETACWTMLSGVTIAVASEVFIPDNIEIAKKSKPTHKEKADDKPSWVNKDMIDWDLSAQKNARQIMDSKYGKGGWDKNTGNRSFSKILKWLTRTVGLRQVISGIPDYGYFFTDAFGYLNYYVNGELYIVEGNQYIDIYE